MIVVRTNEVDKKEFLDLLLLADESESMIAKYLERIADQAVNICEWVHFSQTGEHKNTRIF